MSTLATQIVHWPGQDNPACDKHATKLRGLASVLGFAVSSTIALRDDVPCANCANEELEPVRTIAERVFPDEVAELRGK